MAHEYEDPKNALILVVGLGSIVALAGSMFGLGSYYRMLRDEQLHEKILGVDNPQLIEQHKHEAAALSGYSYADKAKGQVRIPVSEAMKMLAKKGRDGVPSIQPDPKTIFVHPPADGAPAASGSAHPAGSGSAAPAGSAPAGEDKGDKDKKDKDKDKKDKDKKDKDKKDKH